MATATRRARATQGPIRPDYPEPLWVQVRDLISAQVADGSLRPGMRIPPERELCRQLSVSRVTLRKALIRLVEEGVLSAAHGRGWYVTETPAPREFPNDLESFSETAARMGLVPSARVLRSTVEPASLDLASELGIAPGTPLFVLERVRYLDGVPIAVDLTQLPVSLVPAIGGTDFSSASLYETLTAAGVAFSGASASIEARPADAHLAAQLELEEGRPILALSQIVLDAEERPLFVSLIQYRGDRYRLRTSLSRSPAQARGRGTSSASARGRAASAGTRADSSQPR
jgi:DNA-binding GntR family transcriptional regulator